MTTEAQPDAESRSVRIHSTDDVVLAVHELSGQEMHPMTADSPTAPSTSTDPDGPLCLIAHATGFHGRCYRVLAQELSRPRESVPILAPDLRGHGDSTAPQGTDYSWDGFARDVLAVLDHYGFPPTRGIGHSMGGAALLRAEQLRPGTFEHLFLFEPIVFPPQLGRTGSDSPLVGAAERRRAHFPSYQEAVERFASKPPLDVLDPRCLEDYVRFGFRAVDPDRPEGGIALKFPCPEEADVYRMSTVHPTWDDLAEVATPTVVARGTAVPGGPVDIAPALVERLPRGRLLDFGNLGHFGPLQEPSAIAREVLASWPAR